MTELKEKKHKKSQTHIEIWTEHVGECGSTNEPKDTFVDRRSG